MNEKVITIEGEEGNTVLRATKLGEGERACLAFEFLGWSKSRCLMFFRKPISFLGIVLRTLGYWKSILIGY